MRKCGRIQLECGLILPVREARSTADGIIIPIKGVGNELAVQQVGLNHSRNLRGMPFPSRQTCRQLATARNCQPESMFRTLGSEACQRCCGERAE